VTHASEGCREAFGIGKRLELSPFVSRGFQQQKAGQDKEEWRHKSAHAISMSAFD
jgi:hypothetical protein